MNWKRFFAAVFALLVVLSLGATRVAAQTSTTGDLTGTVTDPSGSVVPNAKVTLRDETKGNTQETTTSREGTFRLPADAKPVRRDGERHGVRVSDAPRGRRSRPDRERELYADGRCS